VNGDKESGAKLNGCKPFGGAIVGQWISVLEQLPPADTPVLVWVCRWPAIAGPRIAALAPPMDEGEWLTAYWCDAPQRGAFAHVYDEDGNPSAHHVSHWMPLPSSPNGKDQQ
jgi:hypothetical protein